MDTEQTDPNILLLSLNLSDSEPEEAAAPTTNTASTTGPTTEYQPTRAERTALSEEAFQALKQSYRPKVENGNIYKTIPLPLPPLATPLPKPDAQALLHATEELYFFRQYAQAVAFVRRVLDGDGNPDGDRDGGNGAAARSRIDVETRRLLGYYLSRCLVRLNEEEERGGDGEKGGGTTAGSAARSAVAASCWGRNGRGR